MRVRMYIVPFFLIGFILIFPLQIVAVDLNAPAEKKVTVGSEIERGKAAISDVDSKIKSTNHFGRMKAFDAVFDYNKQANTDTQAFILGASLSALINLDRTLRLASETPNSRLFPADEMELVERDAREYFKEVRKIQKELNIDDQALIKATHYNPDLMKANLYRWNKQFK
jgi:hypothetical protein